MKFKIENLGYIANIRFVAEEDLAMRIIDRIVLENEREEPVVVDDWWCGRPISFNGQLLKPADSPFISLSCDNSKDLYSTCDHYTRIIEEMGGKIIEWAGE